MLVFVSFLELDKTRGWRFVTTFVAYFFSGKLSRQFDFGKSYMKDILFGFFLVSNIFVPVLCCFSD